VKPRARGPLVQWPHLLPFQKKDSITLRRTPSLGVFLGEGITGKKGLVPVVQGPMKQESLGRFGVTSDNQLGDMGGRFLVGGAFYTRGLVLALRGKSSCKSSFVFLG